MNRRMNWITAAAAGLLLTGATAARAQTPMVAMLTHLKEVKAKLGKASEHLSSGAQNLFHLVDAFEKNGISIEQLGSIGAPRISGFAAGKPVSSPDFSNTRLTGFTQSETSTAWCGKNAVVGFNDSASFEKELPAYVAGTSAISFQSYSVSSNKGGTWSYKGTTPLSSDVHTFLSGDPVIGCSSETEFAYASLYEVFDNCGSGHTPTSCNSGISVQTSIDGGQTFSAPVEAVAKDGDTHFLDKDWMAVVPGSSDIYVTYTDFDFSGTSSCGAVLRTGIELVKSIDGGKTWLAPVVVNEQCNIPPYDQGSQVAVDAKGDVYVAWELFEANFFSRKINIATSTDGGATFGSPILVSAVNPAGDGDSIIGFQGDIRNTEFPSLAIGKGKTDAGHLYITWNDGDKPVKDFLINFYTGGALPTYNFSDVLFTSSTDGGTTWSKPVIVNNKAGAAKGATDWDAFRPGVTSDKTGRIAVCFYDRRRDLFNFTRDHFCASSKNGGASWANSKITPAASSSLVNQDIFIAGGYDGDYDAPASDALNLSAGFLSSYSDNAPGHPTAEVNKY